MTRLVAIGWNKPSPERGWAVVVACMRCGNPIQQTQDGVADLDGPAFRAFYHDTCADVEFGK